LGACVGAGYGVLDTAWGAVVLQPPDPGDGIRDAESAEVAEVSRTVGLERHDPERRLYTRRDTTMDPMEKLALEERRLAVMRERITKYSMLKVGEVAAHLNVARTTVEELPWEILPHCDVSPTAKRQHRRYHPLDVQAATVYLREWTAAKQMGEGEAYLRTRQAELAEQEREIKRLAREARRLAA
jgi:hypothetical protein